MAPKIVLSCDQSLLSRHLIEALEKEPFSIKILPQELLQESDDQASALAAYFAQECPDLFINSLAYSVGESLERRARLVPIAEILAGLAAEQGFPILQLSSHEVFGGENLTVYREDDHPSPVSAFGQVLWEAERKVQMLCEQHIILRLSWLISSQGDSVFGRLLDLMQHKERVEVSSERRASPTFKDDASRVIVAICKQLFSGSDNWGVYHYASADACTEREFAEYLRDIMDSLGHKPGTLVEDESEREYPSAALGCLACRDDFGVQQRSWRLRLEARVNAWFDAKQ